MSPRDDVTAVGSSASLHDAGIRPVLPLGAGSGCLVFGLPDGSGMYRARQAKSHPGITRC